MTELEAIRHAIRQKGAKLEHLRGVQRTLAELDELAEEKRQNWEKRFRKQRESIQRRSELSGTGSSDAFPSEIDLESNDLDHTATAAPTQGLRGTNLEVESEELRNAFNALVNKGNDDQLAGEDMVAMPPPPSPPARFTSTALPVTLECLGDSLVALVEVTDNVCVLATFKTREEPVNLNPHMQSLMSHVVYSQKALLAAVRHLERFIIGEKALLEGGSFEVNSLREQFLMHKEALTAQEQREKQLEDVRNGLHTRLQLLCGRLAMWEEVFFGRRSAFAQRLGSMSGRLSVTSRISIVSGMKERSPSVPRLLHPRRGSRYDYCSTTSAFSQDTAFTSALGKPSTFPAAFKEPHTDSAAAASAPAPAPAPAAGGGSDANAEYYAGVSRGVVTKAEDEALERRLARKWGNPYVAKALQYEERQKDSYDNTLLSYFKRTGEFVDGGDGSVHEASRFADCKEGQEGQVGTALGVVSMPPNALSENPSSSVCGTQRSVSPYSWPDDTGAGTGENPSGSVQAASDVESGGMATAVLEGEARAMADTRLLSLLQSLLRTIPAATFTVDVGDADADAVEAEGKASGRKRASLKQRERRAAEEKRKADEEARLATRNSINRLVRRLQKVLMKERESKPTVSSAADPSDRVT